MIQRTDMEKFVLIFSDSHGRSYALLETVERIRERLHPDMILFLGDGEGDLHMLDRNCGLDVIAVRGNCDFFSDGPAERMLDINGRKILMMHGHTQGVKSGTGNLEAYAAKRGADAVLYGHTHERDEHTFVYGDKTVTVFNPGAVYNGSFGTLTVRDDGTMLFGYGEI